MTCLVFKQFFLLFLQTSEKCRTPAGGVQPRLLRNKPKKDGKTSQHLQKAMGLLSE